MQQFTYKQVIHECNRLIRSGQKNRINMIQIQKLDHNRFAAEVIRGGIREPTIVMETKGYNELKRELNRKYLLQLPPCSYLHFWRNDKGKTVAYIQIFMKGESIDKT